MVYLNVRSEITEVLGENIGGTLLDINCSNIFLDQSPEAKEINSKINKWDLIKPMGKSKESLRNRGMEVYSTGVSEQVMERSGNQQKQVPDSYGLGMREEEPGGPLDQS